MGGADPFEITGEGVSFGYVGAVADLTYKDREQPQMPVNTVGSGPSLVRASRPTPWSDRSMGPVPFRREPSGPFIASGAPASPATQDRRDR